MAALKVGNPQGSKVPVLKYNQATFRNHAGRLSVFLTENMERMLAFICQHEVSSRTVYTEGKFQRPDLSGTAYPVVLTYGL